jgi:4-coumarate--CoA ligase
VAWVAEHVSSYKRLRGGVVFLPAIPKSPSGKILRKDLREMARKEKKTSKL